ncbi:hypothetical protein D3C87_1541460 [compost metagenome]
MLTEDAQDLELDGRELEGLAIAGRLEALEVHPGGAELEKDPLRSCRHGRLLPAGAPQEGLDAREQFFQVEGLGHVVVGPDAKALDLLEGLATRRQHQHRGDVARPAQSPAQVEPAHPGQHEIEDDQVEGGLLVDEQALGLHSVLDEGDAVALELQIEHEPVGDMGLVLDEQDLRHPFLLAAGRRTWCPCPRPRSRRESGRRAGEGSRAR